PPNVPVHRGTLAEAFRRSRPDVVHVHTRGDAAAHAAELAGFGVPVTTRVHGFRTDEDEIIRTLGSRFIGAVVCFPHQAGRFSTDSRVVPAAVPFNTALFGPQRNKDRRMVLRVAAAQPGQNLELFINVAARLRDFHFTLALAEVSAHGAYL